jgi:hypothetical protein
MLLKIVAMRTSAEAQIAKDEIKLMPSIRGPMLSLEQVKEMLALLRS